MITNELEREKPILITGDADSALNDLFQIHNPDAMLKKLQYEADLWKCDFIYNHGELARIESRDQKGPRRKNTVMDIKVVTSARRRRDIIVNLINEARLSPHPEYPMEDEADIKLGIGRLADGDSQEDYGWRVAEGKMGDGITTMTTIAADTTLHHRDKIIEKPKSLTDAFSLMMALSGERVTQWNSVVTVIPTKCRRAIRLISDIKLSYTFKWFNEKTANDLIDREGNHVLDVAGALDCVDDDIRHTVIDTRIPVRLTSSGTLGNTKEMIIEGKLIDSMKSYFAGAPEHPIRGLLAFIQPVYRGIQPLLNRPRNELDEMFRMADERYRALFQTEGSGRIIFV